MSILEKLRDLWANRNRASEGDARAAAELLEEHPNEINKDNVGAGGLYSPIVPPGYVRDEDE